MKVLNFFSFGAKVDFNTNKEAQIYWQKQKEKLRLRIAFFFAVFNLLGVSFANTHNVRISHDFANKLSSYFTFLQGFGSMGINLSGLNNVDNPLRIIFLMIFVYLAYYCITYRDPFSDPDSIRDLGDQGDIGKADFYLRELIFYAKHAPSNQLPQLCDKMSCNIKGNCDKRLVHEGDYKTRMWGRLFAALRPDVAVRFYRAAYQCRAAFFLKYGFMMSSVFLIIVYVAGRLVEATHGLPVSYMNSSLFLWFAISISMCGYFSFVNYGGESCKGVWANYRATVNDIIKSDYFLQVFFENICVRNPYERQIRDLRTLTECVDSVVVSKICARIDELDMQKRVGDKSTLRRLLSRLVEMYAVLFNNQHSFRAAIFVLSSDKNCLIPIVCGLSKNAEFISINEGEATKACASSFVLDKDSIVVGSWKQNKVISTNSNIPPFYETQHKHLKSIIAYPLGVDPQIRKGLGSRNILMEDPLGVLCLDSSSEKCFSAENSVRNEALIKPFVTRIIFETIMQYLDTISIRGEQK